MNLGWHMDRKYNLINAPSRQVGGKSFKRKKKRNWVGGRKIIKFPKEKLKLRGKKLGKGHGENKVAKKTKIRVEKGQTKKLTWDGIWIEKKILLMHHSSTLVH